MTGVQTCALPISTRVRHRHNAKNGVSMQPSSRCFCSWPIFTPTCPNSVLFQASSFVLHYSRHHTIEKFEVEDRPSLYASKTTCSHLASPNHIDSKRNSFFFFPFLGLFRKCKSSGLRSDTEDLWNNLAARNSKNHS